MLSSIGGVTSSFIGDMSNPEPSLRLAVLHQHFTELKEKRRLDGCDPIFVAAQRLASRADELLGEFNADRSVLFAGDLLGVGRALLANAGGSLGLRPTRTAELLQVIGLLETLSIMSLQQVARAQPAPERGLVDSFVDVGRSVGQSVLALGQRGGGGGGPGDVSPSEAYMAHVANTTALSAEVTARPLLARAADAESGADSGQLCARWWRPAGVPDGDIAPLPRPTVYELWACPTSYLCDGQARLIQQSGASPLIFGLRHVQIVRSTDEEVVLAVGSSDAALWGLDADSAYKVAVRGSVDGRVWSAWSEWSDAVTTGGTDVAQQLSIEGVESNQGQELRWRSPMVSATPPMMLEYDAAVYRELDKRGLLRLVDATLDLLLGVVVAVAVAGAELGAGHGAGQEQEQASMRAMVGSVLSLSSPLRTPAPLFRHTVMSSDEEVRLRTQYEDGALPPASSFAVSVRLRRAPQGAAKGDDHGDGGDGGSDADGGAWGGWCAAQHFQTADDGIGANRSSLLLRRRLLVASVAGISLGAVVLWRDCSVWRWVGLPALSGLPHRR